MLEQKENLGVLPGSDQRIIWIPARQTLKHSLFTVPDQLQGRKRASALQLKISAWSPFQNTQVAVAWSGNVASVFAWEKTTLEERMRSHGYDPNNCEVVPEAFMRNPGDDGIRLVSCNDGVEAQVWSQGFLTMSRWWPSIPPAREWALFARTTGTDADTAIPDIKEPSWREYPWNENQNSSAVFANALKNHGLVLTTITVLLAPCFYFAAAWMSYSAMVLAVERDIASVEEESRAIRIERADALSALETAEDLLSLHRYPHQLEILSKAHSLLRQHPVTLTNWDYDDGLLEFGLESDSDMDARVFILAFEEDPLFSSVSAATRGNRLVMRMDIAALEGAE